MGLFSQVTFGKAVDRIFVDSSGRRLAASFVAAFSRSTELDECVCKFLRDDDEDHHGGWKKLNFQHLLQRFTKWPDSKIVSYFESLRESISLHLVEQCDVTLLFQNY